MIQYTVELLYMRRFSWYTVKRAGGSRGNYLRLKTGSLFFIRIFAFSWYTKKRGPTLAGQLSPHRIGVAFFIRILVFFMVRQPANVFCCYVGLPRTEKSAGGVAAGIISSSERDRFFSYEFSLFSWYTEKKRAHAGRPIIFPRNRGGFFHTFAFSWYHEKDFSYSKSIKYIVKSLNI